MGAPEISIILPTYNRAAFLRAAIDSVLSQTFTAWELLIADDGSDEPETLALLDGLQDRRIRVLRLAHAGSPSVARNAGIAEARGEMLAFLDSDDVWLPEKLETQLAALRARPDCGWSYTATDRMDMAGKSLGEHPLMPWAPYDDRMVERLLRIEALIGVPTVMMRRELAIALGGFDPGQRFCEDYDLWIRAAMRSEVVAMDKVLTSVRVHPDHYSRDRLEVYRDWLRLYGKFARIAPDATTRRIARQRKAASALMLARLMLAGSGGRAEAWRYVVPHGPALLSQPREWPSLGRFVARTLVPDKLWRRSR